MVVTVILLVAAATLTVLVVLSVALVRHLKLLAASVGAFRDQAQPVLQDLTSGAASMQERLERMARRDEERKR
jgi:hypothetical protein